MINFKIIGERKYYANMGSNGETNVTIDNLFRLAYFIDNGYVFAYYIGNYYMGYNKNPQITSDEIINEIRFKCSDPYSFEPIEMDIVEID